MNDKPNLTPNGSTVDSGSGTTTSWETESLLESGSKIKNNAFQIEKPT